VVVNSHGYNKERLGELSRIHLLICNQKLDCTDFVKTVNINKIDRLSVQNLKNEFKQNQANQNDKSMDFFLFFNQFCQFIDPFSDLPISFVLQNDL
jgi:hypothetical protein